MNLRLQSLALVSLALAAAQVASAAPASAEKISATLQTIDRVAAAGPFQPNWDSLANYKVPDWYQDAKFGIFIHWGLYSVPAFEHEWYPRGMYDPQHGRPTIHPHHVAAYGPVDMFGYKDFIPLFRAGKFDPAAWARLFREAGAKYVIPVGEHHDGFPMYDSDYTEWSAAKLGPKRDVVGDLAKAVRDEGLVFGASSHRAEHWWFYGPGRKIPSDVQDERYRGLYGPARDRKESEDGKTPPDEAFLTDWLLRTCELVDKYQPQVIWFDWWIAQPAFHPYLQRFAAYYYNRGAEWGKGVAINYKKHGGESFPDTAGVLDIERGQLANKRDLFWQTDTSLSTKSWGYVNDQEYKTVNSIVDDLVDIVSKNGSLLLNIGPKPDGTIPEPEEQMLREIGTWLRLNGEAIYSTRPWSVFGEGATQVVEGAFGERKRKDFTAQDIRFTTRGDTLYAILLDWPGDDATITLKSVTDAAYPHKIARVALLGHSGPLEFDRSPAALTIKLPAKPTADGSLHAFVLKIIPGAE